MARKDYCDCYFEQLSLFDEESPFEESDGNMLCSFSFAQNDIDIILRLASNTEDARMVIAYAFQKQQPIEKIVSLLKTVYHGGAGIDSENGEFSVWYAEDGIHLSLGRTARYSETAQAISWEDATERIGELMNKGLYASKSELESAEENERRKLAESLWCIYHDLSDLGRRLNLLAVLKSFCKGSFPDNTARLTETLKDSAFRENLAVEYSAFLDAYKADRQIMRFHHYKLYEIWERINCLGLPKHEYSSNMAEVPEIKMFITEDEIDAALVNRNSGFSGGKNRIYDFLTAVHDSKEKITFLSHEFGIGGSSHAVSGRGHYSSDGKGVVLQKPKCADVKLSYNNVLSRYENIIKSGRW